MRISEPTSRSLRTGRRADFARKDVHGDLAGLRKDIQALTVRMARIEGFLVGFFAECGPLDRYDVAAWLTTSCESRR